MRRVRKGERSGSRIRDRDGGAERGKTASVETHTHSARLTMRGEGWSPDWGDLEVKVVLDENEEDNCDHRGPKKKRVLT